MDGLLALVAAERGGETVDRTLLSNLLRCFISMGTYMTAFQVRALCGGLPNVCLMGRGCQIRPATPLMLRRASLLQLHASCAQLPLLAAA